MKASLILLASLLAVLPLHGLTVVQQAVLSSQHTQVGTGSPFVSGSPYWWVNPFDSSLGVLAGVTYQADIECNFSSSEVNPFSYSLQHSPGFFLSTTFLLPGATDTAQYELSSRGETIMMPANSSHTFSGMLTGHYIAAGDLANFGGDSPLLVLSLPRIFGLNAYGSALANVTINARLTYEYTTPSEIPRVDDRGLTVLLLGLALLPLVWWRSCRRSRLISGR